MANLNQAGPTKALYLDDLHFTSGVAQAKRMPNLGLVKEGHWKVFSPHAAELNSAMVGDMFGQKTARQTSRFDRGSYSQLNVAGSILSSSFKRNCIGVERISIDRH